jgi:hypothetical protein
VDASGKVELEDWVEVRHPAHPLSSRDFTFHDLRNRHPIA